MDKIPRHIAIIMDGNGRWAAKRGLPRIAGHRAGAKSVRRIVEASAEMGIKALTLYTFSSENWKRPKKEVDALMKMLKENLSRELPELQKNNIRFNVIGRSGEFSKGLREEIENARLRTSANSGLILTLALNYGGRREIIDAVKNIISDISRKKLNAEDITEEAFSAYLYTRDLPEVDLMIRTSGEMRISNFLLWQLSYSELYVTEKLWPDFGREDLKKAVEEFKRRQRRFGGIQ